MFFYNLQYFYIVLFLGKMVLNLDYFFLYLYLMCLMYCYIVGFVKNLDFFVLKVSYIKMLGYLIYCRVFDSFVRYQNYFCFFLKVKDFLIDLIFVDFVEG